MLDQSIEDAVPSKKQEISLGEPCRRAVRVDEDDEYLTHPQLDRETLSHPERLDDLVDLRHLE